MPCPTDKPLARARAHLAAGRFAEAVGGFRAVLAIDPFEVHGRIGLAQALAGRGDREAAVDGLVEQAQRLAEGERREDALRLYAAALAIEPSRHELHLDIAFVESALGRHEAAVARIEGLADWYMECGRTDEGAELLRFLASWDPEAGAEEVPAITTETVVCATVLVRPDGTLMFPDGTSLPERRTPRAVSAPIVLDDVELDPDMITNVAHPPPAPRAARPAPRASEDASLEDHAKLRVARAPRPGPSAPPAPRVGPPPAPPIGRGRPMTAASEPPRPAAPARGPVHAPSSAASPVAARPAAPRPAPARPASATPASRSVPARRPAGTAESSPLAGRLRKRAGLNVGGSPRPVRARATEPITVRRAVSAPSYASDDEVTRCFRVSDLERTTPPR